MHNFFVFIFVNYYFELISIYKFKKNFFYIILFCNLNFIIGNFVNHYSYISSDLTRFMCIVNFI